MIRILDIIISLIVIFIFSPIFVIISIIIKADSKGPIFFVHKRIGRLGNPFYLYKFRTLYSSDISSGLLTLGLHDNRVTKFGKFLRKYKLDEFPQFINVLSGKMSIVGPRPEVENYTRLYSEDQKKILKVKPGITDWASIIFMDEGELLFNAEDPEIEYISNIMPKKIEYNMIFINNYKTKEYFKIIYLTILKIVNR